MGCKWLYASILLCLLVGTIQSHSENHHHHHHDHDHDHNHDHDHDHHHHEAPSFKYSRAANEKINTQAPTHNHEQHSKLKESRQPITPNSDIWLYAMGSTLLISAAPVVILLIVPLDNTEQKQPLLKILLGFASGGLLGDAFLHLIPHATMETEGHSHDHSHHHHEHLEDHGHDISVGLSVLSGILAFLVIEKAVRFIKGGHGHSHSSQVQAKPSKSSMKIEKKNNYEKSEDKKEKEADVVKPPEIKVAGYLNLAADFSHNFTDGLAIGASYLAGNSIGLITTITILLHEVPHEIGDFAILVQSGVSRKNAMLLQLSTAVGALAGTALSLSAQDGYGLLATNWILPFTAGGFIYIALVSVIPELLDEEKPSLVQTILQIGAMLGGVYMMVRIAELE